MTKNFFLWGAATSSHQVEGHNLHNDWWAWEHQRRVLEPSGAACDQYARYGADIDLIATLGHNAHRFSIEWSRLEPQENVWNEGAFRHYEDLLKRLHQKGIEPLVTLHHFTNPIWFAAKGGWEHPEAIYYYLRYVERAVRVLGPYVRFWVTLNEPLVYIYFGYLDGTWPPGVKNASSAVKVLYHLIKAHLRAYELIHDYYQRELFGPVWVSIAKHLSWFTPARRWHPLDHYSTWLRNWFFNEMLLNALIYGFLFFPGVFCEFLPRTRSLDYIGLNYYTRDFIRFRGWGMVDSLGIQDDKARHLQEITELNQMGWEVYPEGLYRMLKRLQRYELPLIITENGICAEQDEQRQRFIRDHLHAVVRAAKEGADVRGYFYWSLLDNYEWAHGFGPRFGIVEVDYATQERRIRKSAQILSETCRNICSERGYHAKGFI